MAREGLSRYYYLEKEIKRDKEEIIELETQLTHITQTPSDMPKSKGQNDKMDRLMSILIERKELLGDKILRAEEERNRILKYINSIDDSLIRLIIQYRFLNLLPWAKVAYFVGGNNTEESVRKMFERYISSH